MGCDIHTVVQRKEKDKWVTIEDHVCDDRSYMLFSMLCGVRSTGRWEHPSICNFRGFPEDFEIDEETHPWRKIFYDAENIKHEISHHTWMGEHSYNWVAFAELMEWRSSNIELIKKEFGDDIDPITRLICVLEEYDPWWMPIRFVFGFDN